MNSVSSIFPEFCLEKQTFPQWCTQSASGIVDGYSGSHDDEKAKLRHAGREQNFRQDVWHCVCSCRGSRKAPDGKISKTGGTENKAKCKSRSEWFMKYKWLNYHPPATGSACGIFMYTYCTDAGRDNAITKGKSAVEPNVCNLIVSWRLLSQPFWLRRGWWNGDSLCTKCTSTGFNPWWSSGVLPSRKFKRPIPMSAPWGKSAWSCLPLVWMLSGASAAECDQKPPEVMPDHQKPR